MKRANASFLILGAALGRDHDEAVTGSEQPRFALSATMSASIKGRVLIIGASRGLGFAFVEKLLKSDVDLWVTTREHPPKALSDLGQKVHVIQNIELEEEAAPGKIVAALDKKPLDLLLFNAGYFTTETFEKLNFSEERKMMEICAYAPLRIVQALVLAGLLPRGSKVLLITSEGGSIGLRTEKEGGANYGHHMSKCAANMMGKLLAWDIKPRGVAVVMVHPGFLRTDMTKHYSHLYEELGAVLPEQAVDPILKCAVDLTLDTTGRFVAALGSKGLGLGVWALPDPDALVAGGDLPW